MFNYWFWSCLFIYNSTIEHVTFGSCVQKRMWHVMLSFTQTAAKLIRKEYRALHPVFTHSTNHVWDFNHSILIYAILQISDSASMLLTHIYAIPLLPSLGQWNISKIFMIEFPKYTWCFVSYPSGVVKCNISPWRNWRGRRLDQGCLIPTFIWFDFTDRFLIRQNLSPTMTFNEWL